MLRAAVDYARSGGARLVEAYPVDEAGASHPDSMFFGAKSMYDRAGFREVARRKTTRRSAQVASDGEGQERVSADGAAETQGVSGRMSKRVKCLQGTLSEVTNHEVADWSNSQVIGINHFDTAAITATRAEAPGT